MELAESRGPPELIEDRRLAGVVFEGPGERAGKPAAAARERDGEPREPLEEVSAHAAIGGSGAGEDEGELAVHRPLAEVDPGTGRSSRLEVRQCPRPHAFEGAVRRHEDEAGESFLAEPLAAGPERVDHRRAIGS